MRVVASGWLALWACALSAESLTGRAQRYLTGLIRIDTSNPPGRESRAAEYLRSIVSEEGISSELSGADPARLNFIARLPGSGKRRPLLLMAHTDVVAVEREQWSVDPFGAELRDGFLHGRGAIDDKSLLAAELAVLVELKRQGVRLERDVILMAEADEEEGSSGIRWLVRHAWPKIEAEFALNEGGFILDLPSGARVFHVQTSEKIPTRAVLRVRGIAGHGSLPRPDNALLRLAEAVVKLAEADQPVRLNPTTRRYLADLARLPDFAWLAPLLPKLQKQATSLTAANEVRWRDPEIDAQLRTTVVPTVFAAGGPVNVIPAMAEARLDVRRLPNETAAEVLARLRRIVHDSTVEFESPSGEELPAAEPSSISTALFRSIEQAARQSSPRAVVTPYMQRGATDGAVLRAKGMPVYGVPIFRREDRENRSHGADERISVANLSEGTELLWRVVSGVAAAR